LRVIWGVFGVGYYRRYATSRRGIVTGSIRERRIRIVSIEAC
jgi:hypothetical protein